MAFTRTFLNTILGVFHRKYYSMESYLGDRGRATFENYDFLSAFLKLRDNTNPEVKERFTVNHSYEEVLYSDETRALPLTVGYVQNKRTADSIVKWFFEVGRYQQEVLKKAITNKGEVYYGAPGLILDKDLNPILICFIEYHKGSVAEYYSSRYIVKISPRVFSSDGLIEKAIIKKLIPIFSNTRYCNFNGAARIMIEDIDDYVLRPIAPQDADIQASLKKVISESKNEIIEGVL